MNTIYKLTARIVFPEGVAPGAGTRSNRRIVARNGKNNTVLRGTALAGAVRSFFEELAGKDRTKHWFGAALDEQQEAESVIRIEDAVIDCRTVTERTHNMVNRHTGAVAKGALFSMEAIPPHSTAPLSITLKNGAGTPQEYSEFIETLARVLHSEPVLGGNGNRGIGRMQILEDIHLRTFDLDTVDGTADWMDAVFEERLQGVQLKGDPIKAVPAEDSLHVDLALGIPRGEDVLIGDGQETDYALQPQKVIFADGTEHWRIPGSSLRGIVRAWMTRLAVRNGEHVCDALSRWGRRIPDGYKPDDTGWGFVAKEDREQYQNNPLLLDDPILDLFGSMYKKGRIHITDSFSSSPTATSDSQERMHVAIDRFSGGANEGALFNNQVLIGSRQRFSLRISITDPNELEVGRLVKTLRAIHLGILLIGSSKSGGRLEIQSIAATGRYEEMIGNFSKEIM